MNIHEYQAKALLKGYGAPVADGVAIFSVDEAAAAAKSLPGPLYVVKSQIHAGGRGKGKFKELGPDAKGGVRLSKSIDEVVANASRLIVFTSKMGLTSPASFICRFSLTARLAALPSWCRLKAEWISKRLPMTHLKRS